MNCDTCKNYVPKEEPKSLYKVGDWVWVENVERLLKITRVEGCVLAEDDFCITDSRVRPAVPADFVGGMFAWEYTNKYRHTGRDILTVNGIDGGRLCVENAYGNTHSVSQSDLSPIRESDWTVEVKGVKVSARETDIEQGICIVYDDGGSDKKYHMYENKFKPLGLEICQAIGVPVRRRV